MSSEGKKRTTWLAFTLRIVRNSRPEQTDGVTLAKDERGNGVVSFVLVLYVCFLVGLHECMVLFVRNSRPLLSHVPDSLVMMLGQDNAAFERFIFRVAMPNCVQELCSSISMLRGMSVLDKIGKKKCMSVLIDYLRLI